MKTAWLGPAGACHKSDLPVLKTWPVFSLTMTTITTIFLDDGGVLNDNARRGPLWQPLVGEFFAPRLGGAPEAWGPANRAVMERLLAPDAWEALMSALPNYADFEREYDRRWLGGMLAELGLPPLPDAQLLALAAEAEAAIAPRAHAALPGAVEGVRALHAAGYTLHTASGESSALLAAYLGGMGLRECFGRLYGPDLVNQHKSGPAYYQRILADLGLPAEQALFVDDSPQALAWAAQTGARTGLVSSVASLADLLPIINA